MEITAYTLKNAPEPDKIRKLYRRAFPKEERLPWPVMVFLTARSGTEITAYYHGDAFCGFTFTATWEKTLFVLFLAVEDGLRGHGYGSAILTYLRETDPQRQILLNVELLDPEADNYAQRLQRMAFYEKNGFKFLHKTEDEEKQYFLLEDEIITTRLMYFDLKNN